MSYLPENYPASRETVCFQQALQPEAEGLWAARDDLLAQLDLWTATWGLDLWEAALGLSNGQGLDLRALGGVQRHHAAAGKTEEDMEWVEVDGEPFMRLLNGAHELIVSASDGKVTAVHKLAFTKAVYSAGVTLETPMEADDQIRVMVMALVGSVPADAELEVLVTNNAKDDEPVWEDATGDVKNGTNHVFANQTAANGFAFNFKLTVSRGENGQGGYLTSIGGAFE